MESNEEPPLREKGELGVRWLDQVRHHDPRIAKRHRDERQNECLNKAAVVGGRVDMRRGPRRVNVQIGGHEANARYNGGNRWIWQLENLPQKLRKRADGGARKKNRNRCQDPGQGGRLLRSSHDLPRLVFHWWMVSWHRPCTFSRLHLGENTSGARCVDTSQPRPALEIPFALAGLGDSQGRLSRASVKSKLALAACTDGVTLPMNTSAFCKRRSL